MPIQRYALLEAAGVRSVAELRKTPAFGSPRASWSCSQPATPPVASEATRGDPGVMSDCNVPHRRPVSLDMRRLHPPHEAASSSPGQKPTRARSRSSTADAPSACTGVRVPPGLDDSALDNGLSDASRARRPANGQTNPVALPTCPRFRRALVRIPIVTRSPWVVPSRVVASGREQVIELRRAAVHRARITRAGQAPRSGTRNGRGFAPEDLSSVRDRRRAPLFLDDLATQLSPIHASVRSV